MAVIANSVAAPGQWTPSLLKSGKPRALSMLEAVTATSSSEACPRDSIRGWRPVRARKTHQYKKISRPLISIKPEAPAMVLMKAVALRSARHALD
jgi:hypothetical protein